MVNFRQTADENSSIKNRLSSIYGSIGDPISITNLYNKFKDNYGIILNFGRLSDSPTPTAQSCTILCKNSIGSMSSNSWGSILWFSNGGCAYCSINTGTINPFHSLY